MPKAELQGHLNSAGRAMEESPLPEKFTWRQELETGGGRVRRGSILVIYVKSRRAF